MPVCKKREKPEEVSGKGVATVMDLIKAPGPARSSAGAPTPQSGPRYPSSSTRGSRCLSSHHPHQNGATGCSRSFYRLVGANCKGMRVAGRSMDGLAAIAPVRGSPTCGPVAAHCQLAGVPGSEMGSSAAGRTHPGITLAAVLDAGL